MRRLTAQLAQKAGMLPLRDEQMDNGELRFRRMHTDGSGYIRTQTTEGGGWQNAHCHHAMRELYAVERGQIALIWRDGDRIRCRILRAGDSHLVLENLPHNVYMWGETVIHTVKFHVRATSSPDWHADDSLQKFTHELSPEDIEDLASRD